MRGKRVLICTNAYPPNFIGGAELIAHYQAKTLQKLGYDVVVFAGELNNRGSRYSINKGEYEDITIYRVCLHDRDYSSDFFNFYHKQVESIFSDILTNFSPDVVHFHNIIGLSASLLRAAKQRNIKTILTLHDYWGICYKNTLLRDDSSLCEVSAQCKECKPYIAEGQWTNIPVRMRRDFILLQLGYVDTFISPSAYLAQKYINSGLNAEKMKLIPNGIDIKRFSNIKKTLNMDKVRFSFVGYLGKHKGIGTIIESLQFIKNKGHVQINLIGDGEDRDLYNKRIDELGWTDSVKLCGKVDNSRIEDVYRETDVLLLPSIWPENQPVSITEAMAARIPVIASRIGGIPELVEEGITGYLFEAGNANDLAKKIDECICNREKLTQLGENALNKISNYTFDHQVVKITEVYNEHIPQKETFCADKLIICVGKSFNPKYAKMIDYFNQGDSQRYKFLIVDWLNEAEIKQAHLVWVMDNQILPEDLTPAVTNYLPLVVPEENDALKKLCTENNCGLYYNDALEAAVCLEYLLEHDDIGRIFAQNSKKRLFVALNG